MYSIKLLLYTSKKKNDGSSPLVIRMISNRKAKYIYLGYYLQPEEWDEKKARVKKTHPNSTRLNLRIQQKLTEVNKMILIAEEDNMQITNIQLKEKIRNQNLSSFFRLAIEYEKDLEKLKKYNQLSSDKPRINHFKKFLEGNDINFTQISIPLLKRFMIDLQVTRGVNEWTVMNHLVVIRTIFNRAIGLGLVDPKYYPFGPGKIQIKFPESVKIGLNEEEVKKLAEIKLAPFSAAWHARNIWLCSFYLAGIRISDVVKLNWTDFNDGRLVYIMGKNKKIVSLKVPEKINEILAMYQTKENCSKFIFPYLLNANEADAKKLQTAVRNANCIINDQLRVIGNSLGIKKKLSMHISRHTFGQIAGDKISPQVLQKLYRHSDLKTTIGYQANFIHAEVDDALNSVIDF